MRQVRWSAAWQALGGDEVLVHQNTGVPGGREDEMRPVRKALQAVREAAHQLADCTHHRNRRKVTLRRTPVVSLSLVFCAVTACGFDSQCVFTSDSLSLSSGFSTCSLDLPGYSPLLRSTVYPVLSLTHSSTQAYAASLLLCSMDVTGSALRHQPKYGPYLNALLTYANWVLYRWLFET